MNLEQEMLDRGWALRTDPSPEQQRAIGGLTKSFGDKGFVVAEHVGPRTQVWTPIGEHVVYMVDRRSMYAILGDP